MNADGIFSAVVPDVELTYPGIYRRSGLLLDSRQAVVLFRAPERDGALAI